MPTTVTAIDYATTLIDLVNIDRADDPAFAIACLNVATWGHERNQTTTALHDICDANMYLLEADDIHGLETSPQDDTYCDFVLTAIAYAESILFRMPGDDHRTWWRRQSRRRTAAENLTRVQH